MEPSRIAQALFNVVPNDNNYQYFISLRADTAGTLRILTVNNPTPVNLNVVAGEIIPVIVTRVYATGTTATILGFR